jgi:hypothetical protein
MSKNVTRTLIAAHLLEGRMEAGQEIGTAIETGNGGVEHGGTSLRRSVS